MLPLLQRVKSVYILWYGYYQVLPKDHRHSLGQRIDALFIEIIESIAIASFLSKEEKQPWIRIAIRKTDTLKILLMVLWETKSLDNNKYIAVSMPLNEIGKMLGGWNGQVTRKVEEVKVKPLDIAQSKQNSPSKKPEEK
ncbi:MAG: four helix bundle protein [Candidatus Vogelbacteria bacterium]|nr:four helix bundle protein [Candidatus Vogelbacteria bacterium]